jgi:hypothetical protein
MRRHVALLLGACFITACSTPGLLYTNITLPLTLDMNDTRRAPDSAGAIQRIIREPIAGIRAEWSNNAPGDSARIGGLDQVSYADVRSNSLLGGLWGSTTILVYGNQMTEWTPQTLQPPLSSTRLPSGSPMYTDGPIPPAP